MNFTQLATGGTSALLQQNEARIETEEASTFNDHRQVMGTTLRYKSTLAQCQTSFSHKKLQDLALFLRSR